MPLTVDSVVQDNSGVVSTAAASFAATLGSGTTAGNAVIVVAVFVDGPGPTLPTGFVTDLAVAINSVVDPRIWVFRKQPVGAGETSWTFTLSSGTQRFVWWAREVSGLDPSGPVETTTGLGNSSVNLINGSTRSTGTSSSTAAANCMVLAMHAALTGADTNNTYDWNSQTGGFTEVADHATNDPGVGVTEYALAVSEQWSQLAGPFASTATWTTDNLDANAGKGWAALIAYRAADSPITTPLQFHTGFEYGTHNGITGSSTNTPGNGVSSAGTVGTNIIVQAGSARNGSYGLRIVQSGAAAWLGWNAGAAATATLPGSQGALVAGFSVKPVSGSGVLVLAEVAPAAGTIAQLVYDATNAKLGWRWGSGGTAAYQSGTTASGTWAWVSARISGFTTATWKIEWQCEEAGVLTAQTGPADLTGQTASALAQVRMGCNSAQTVTADFDDVCLTTSYPVYPLAIHKVQLLTVDPAGTPTSSGTVGNFALVTSNATGAALTAGTLTSARNNIDEVPPTISAASDGVVQTTTAATDYLEFPMADATVTASEIIAGVRLLACMISTTGAGAGSVGIRGYDGATETSLIGTGFTWTPGSSTTVSSTVPPWVTAQWNRTGGWTKTALDAAALRFGFSGDATPDMGIHAMYLEVATRATNTYRMFGVDGDVVVDANENPHTLGLRSLVTTTPTGKATTVHYELNAAGTDVNVPAASSDTETLDAPDKPTANFVAIYPDPEGVPDA